MAENMEEQRGTKCPICGKGLLKSGDNQIYCSEYKPKKVGKDWINEGDCDFHIFREDKFFKRKLNNADFKKLFAGEALKDTDGNTLEFDPSSQYFTKITFAPKKEDRNF